ncbi:MAG TPA: peptidylprolyl isomerase [bacterium]|nr:peptidylprolyl isomerase [bacterium]
MKWFLTIAVAMLVIGCGTSKPAQPAAKPPTPPAQAAQPTPAAAPADTTAAKSATQPQVAGMLKDTLVATKLPDSLFFNIKVKDFGTMKIQMYTKDAPLNVTNVANLGIKGFYNGLTFHRLIPGFMIQGGDPSGNGTGGPGYTVAAEIKKPHTKGAMAMARTGDNVNPGKRSSGSQFYICFQPTPQLDGQYTVIGQLVAGDDVLAKLEQVKTGPMDKPLTPVVMEQVWVTNQ